MERVTAQDLIRWSEALAGVARTGLGFTDSLYERERFEEILHIAADIRTMAANELDPAHRVTEWLRLVGQGTAGYVTPKVAIGAVVGNDDGELLLIQRADSGVWLYPTGWADIGYSPAEVAVKEVREETGIDCEVQGILGVLDGLRRGFTSVPLYSVVFLCRATGGTLAPHPLETRGAGFFAADALPEPLAGSGNLWELIFRAVRGEPYEVFYDEPRPEVWRQG
ncbi:MAG: NUDIX hydrolase N-terminal domain-containing protein [Acidimicrobiia bacterium]